jgi:hypothetical protein
MKKEDLETIAKLLLSCAGELASMDDTLAIEWGDQGDGAVKELIQSCDTMANLIHKELT